MHRNRWFLPVISWALLTSSFWMLADKNAGRIEGYFFPVMGPLEIHAPNILVNDQTRVSWRGSAMKLRGCDHIETRWFLGPRGGRRVQVSFYYTDPPQVRTSGILEWDGMVVSLSISETLTNSHADVYHQCPWRPWQTQTRFYDPREVTE